MLVVTGNRTGPLTSIISALTTELQQPDKTSAFHNPLYTAGVALYASGSHYVCAVRTLLGVKWKH